MKRDFSPAKTFGPMPGELWVGFRLPSDANCPDPIAEEAVERLTKIIESSGLGRWIGQSVGANQRDVTFSVASVRAAAATAKRVCRGSDFPYDYWISDCSESPFGDFGENV